MEMSKESLRQICKEHKLFVTPHLNDKLYCNFKGFGSVANLEEYVNLKALFLEGNAIESLQGLPALPELKCLYAQSNLLTSLEGLGRLAVLDTLNVSANQLTCLQHLEHLTSMHTLVCADNQLEAADSIQQLSACTSLESLDLQNNKLSEPAALDVLRALPQLKCLYLKGNPLVSSLNNYRKVLISAIPTLSYLDDRPVFERERRCAEAWARGGLDGEREARAQSILEEQQRERRNFEALQRVRQEGFAKRREALGLPSGSTDPFFDTVDDSEWQSDEEPEELRAAKERLAAYTAAEYEEPLPDLTEDYMRIMYEDREATRAEALQDYATQLATNNASTRPEENADPNAAAAAHGIVTAGVAPRAAQALGPVPEARVTVAVQDSACCGGTCSASGAGTAEGGEGNEEEEEEADRDDEPEQAAPRLAGGADWAGPVTELAKLAIMGDAGSDAGSDSVASSDVGDLDALD